MINQIKSLFSKDRPDDTLIRDRHPELNIYFRELHLVYNQDGEIYFPENKIYEKIINDDNLDVSPIIMGVLGSLYYEEGNLSSVVINNPQDGSLVNIPLSLINDNDTIPKTVTYDKNMLVTGTFFPNPNKIKFNYTKTEYIENIFDDIINNKQWLNEHIYFIPLDYTQHLNINDVDLPSYIKTKYQDNSYHDVPFNGLSWNTKDKINNLPRIIRYGFYLPEYVGACFGRKDKEDIINLLYEHSKSFTPLQLVLVGEHKNLRNISMYVGGNIFYQKDAPYLFNKNNISVVPVEQTYIVNVNHVYTDMSGAGIVSQIAEVDPIELMFTNTQFRKMILPNEILKKYTVKPDSKLLVTFYRETIKVNTVIDGIRKTSLKDYCPYCDNKLSYKRNKEGELIAICANYQECWKSASVRMRQALETLDYDEFSDDELKDMFLHDIHDIADMLDSKNYPAYIEETYPELYELLGIAKDAPLSTYVWIVMNHLMFDVSTESSAKKLSLSMNALKDLVTLSRDDFIQAGYPPAMVDIVFKDNELNLGLGTEVYDKLCNLVDISG